MPTDGKKPLLFLQWGLLLFRPAEDQASEFFQEADGLLAGTASSFVIGNASRDYDGTSAEWITERTKLASGPAALPNLGSIPYNSSYAGTSSLSKSAGQWGAFSLYMVNSQTSHQLAHVNPLDSAGTNFTVVWDNYL